MYPMPKQTTRGAVMLEMALVSVVFFLLIFSLLDLMRFMGIKASLVRGAQSGLTLAEQIAGFEEDVRDKTLGSPQMNNLAAARRARSRPPHARGAEVRLRARRRPRRRSTQRPRARGEDVLRRLGRARGGRPRRFVSREALP